MHTLSYAGYFFANLFAILANVLVGAIPRETGIPVPCVTLFTIFVPTFVKLRIPSNRINASSVE